MEDKEKIEELYERIWQLEKEKIELEKTIDKATTNIVILQEIIYQQPTKNKEDDFWLLDKLDGIKNILKGENNENKN